MHVQLPIVVEQQVHHSVAVEVTKLDQWNRHLGEVGLWRLLCQGFSRFNEA